jgi:hypothetical protein
MLASVRALSSAGERSLHTGEVAGSIPAAPTIASTCLLFTNFGEYTFAKISAHVSAQEITAYLMVGSTNLRAPAPVVLPPWPTSGAWLSRSYRAVAVKSDDPHRRQIVELFDAWHVHHGDRPVKASALAEPVRVLVDPQGRGRQHIAARLVQLTGSVPVASF